MNTEHEHYVQQHQRVRRGWWGIVQWTDEGEDKSMLYIVESVLDV